MPTQTDPTQVVASLDPDAIRKRLAELNAEESALRVLLRAAIARSRAAQYQDSERYGRKVVKQ